MSNEIKSFHDLRIWHSGIEIVEEIYRLTQKFPKEELYGLCTQMRRAAISIPSNIAEGQVRGHTKEFVQFLRIALSSNAELETQIIISYRLGYLEKEKYESILSRLKSLSKQIQALLNKLNRPTTNH